MKQAALTNYLAAYIMEERLVSIERVLANRTRRLTLVLENIFQPHNASATIRSCDCLGVQDMHIIENSNRFAPNKGVTMGAGKWVDVKRWNKEENNTLPCLNSLKNDGYKIIATSLSQKSITLEDINLNEKCAIIFGTEETGLSSAAHAAADEYLRLPMYGFTQSYNISVSVAITLANIMPRMHESHGWQLTKKEIDDLRLTWYKKSIKHVEHYEKLFNQNYQG